MKPDATPAASFTIRAECGLPHVDTDAWRQGQAAKASTQHTSSATSTAIDRRVRLWVHDREASENIGRLLDIEFRHIVPIVFKLTGPSG